MLKNVLRVLIATLLFFTVSACGSRDQSVVNLVVGERISPNLINRTAVVRGCVVFAEQDVAPALTNVCPDTRSGEVEASGYDSYLLFFFSSSLEKDRLAQIGHEKAGKICAFSGRINRLQVPTNLGMAPLYHLHNAKLVRCD